MAECGCMGRQLAQFDSLCAVWGNKLAVEAGRQEDRRCRVCLNLMAFISKLRKKIEPNPEQPFYIQTVRGVGYRFNKEA